MLCLKTSRLDKIDKTPDERIREMVALGMRRGEAVKILHRERLRNERNPPSRLTEAGRHEYRCAGCHQWLRADKYRHHGKGRNVYLNKLCKYCERRLERRREQAIIHTKAKAATFRVARRSELSKKQQVAIENIYADASRLSQETGTPYHVDHILPVNHPLICGLHVPCNLQVLVGVDNIKKSNKFVPYFERPDGSTTPVKEDFAYVVQGEVKRVINPKIRVIKKAKLTGTTTTEVKNE